MRGITQIFERAFGSWAWIFKRYWLLVVSTLFTLILGVWYEPTRWNTVTTAWGVFVAGTVVWLLLETRGDAHRRQVWLRQNIKHLRPVLETILNVSGVTATFALGLPNEVQLELRHGSTRNSRRLAAQSAKAYARDMEMTGSELARQRAQSAYLLMPDIERFSTVIREMASENLGLLQGLADLQGALQQYNVACRMFLGSTSLRNPSPPGEPLWAGVFLSQLGHAAIALSETCSDICCEAGILPEN